MLNDFKRRHIHMKHIFSLLSLLCITLFTASCASDNDDFGKETGYLKLDLTTLVSTHNNSRAVTSAPSGYDPKTIAVKIMKSDGTVVLETSDAANDENFKGNIVLEPGTYTISGSSAGWDGSDSGFDTPYYAGSTTATVSAKTLTRANLTLTQANVKVTVNYDENINNHFKRANCVVTSAIEGVAVRSFGLTTTASAYFPVAALDFDLTLTNKDDNSFTMHKEITDVKARDHIIVNYKLADSGSIGGITVTVDDATQSYTYNISVPRKSSIALQANKANAWSNFADLSVEVTAKTSSFKEESLNLQWRNTSESTWTDVPVGNLTKGENDKYTYRLTGLTPNTAYAYRLAYNDGETIVNSDEVKFTTEAQTALENAGFENWYKDGAIWYPNAQGEKYWDSSNAGSAGAMGADYNVTTGITNGAYEGTSANLQSMYVVIKFAAASLFTGELDGLIGTKGAKLKWGVPFTSRPTALKGYMKYTPGSINRGSQPTGAPASGNKDHCQIFCALLTEQLLVANASADGYEMSTGIDWENDPRVIAYGELMQNTTDSNWKEFNIPLTFHSTTAKPTHLLIVCSSSRWGDYFYGSDTSNLKLDNFSLEYGVPAE